MLGSSAIFLLDNYKSPRLRLEDQPMVSTGKPFQENLPEILICYCTYLGSQSSFP